ncbi:MAG: gamma-glutamyltransferase [Proteobacteria bacterium]|nr:gamma-glutamyltransferase [Pseudomonadota bacterium]
MTAKGVIAAGHPETAAAAAAILAEGGNAFDAVLAAVYTACAVEPVLSSLGGGGFLLARSAEEGAGDPVLYDFFTQTPKRRKTAAEVDFYPIQADFGTVTQEFHIGMGAMATPGTVRGLFQIHRDLCTMPMTRIIEPAVAVARDGFTVNRLQAYLFQVVGPIYMASAASREIFAGGEEPGDLKGEGETMSNPAFAGTLDALAREGEDLFYRGGIADRIAEDCDSGGGMLTTGDFAGYRVQKRRPLGVDYRGARLYTNPPPSSGGILIAFALELLKDSDLEALGFGSVAYLERLAKVMDLTNKARVESRLHETGEAKAAETLLEPKFLAAYKAEVLGRPEAPRGTTHVSIIDAAGNAAAMTLSNGEGAGYMVPGTGIMMNNMLGEEDINPLGFHQWPTDTRMCSMMAPSLAIEGGGRMVALGSGGSNRLRTAILQVLINLLDFSMPLEEAIEAPRVHFEGGLLSIETGFDEDTIGRLVAGFPETKVWEERNLFFGGVHVARFDPAAGVFTGAGDPRRGGTAEVV